MEPATITSAVAALMGIILGLDRWMARRAASNGGSPVLEKDRAAMEVRMLKVINMNAKSLEKHASSVNAHIKDNASEHQDLHSRVTIVQTDVAEIKGEMKAHKAKG